MISNVSLVCRAKEIIKAEKKHIGAISVLLRQVLNIHNQIRPDIFKKDAKKYFTLFVKVKNGYLTLFCDIASGLIV